MHKLRRRIVFFSPKFSAKFVSSQFDSYKFLKIEAVKTANKYLEQRRIRVHPPPGLRDQYWSRPSCPMWRIFKITLKIIQQSQHHNWQFDALKMIIITFFSTWNALIMSTSNVCHLSKMITSYCTTTVLKLISDHSMSC